MGGGASEQSSSCKPTVLPPRWRRYRESYGGVLPRSPECGDSWEAPGPAGRGWPAAVETPSGVKPRSCRQDGGAPGMRRVVPSCVLPDRPSGERQTTCWPGCVVGSWRAPSCKPRSCPQIHRLTIENSNYLVKAFTDAGPPVNGQVERILISLLRERACPERVEGVRACPEHVEGVRVEVPATN